MNVQKSAFGHTQISGLRSPSKIILTYFHSLLNEVLKSTVIEYDLVRKDFRYFYYHFFGLVFTIEMSVNDKFHRNIYEQSFRTIKSV